MSIGFIRIPCSCRRVTRLVQTNPSNAGVRGVRLTTEWVDFYNKNLLGLYFGYNTKNLPTTSPTLSTTEHILMEIVVYPVAKHG